MIYGVKIPFVPTVEKHRNNKINKETENCIAENVAKK